VQRLGVTSGGNAGIVGISRCMYRPAHRQIALRLTDYPGFHSNSSLHAWLRKHQR
jgi:hypothetical protein